MLILAIQVLRSLQRCSVCHPTAFLQQAGVHAPLLVPTHCTVEAPLHSLPNYHVQDVPSQRALQGCEGCELRISQLRHKLRSKFSFIFQRCVHRRILQSLVEERLFAVFLLVGIFLTYLSFPQFFQIMPGLPCSLVNRNDSCDSESNWFQRTHLSPKSRPLQCCH